MPRMLLIIDEFQEFFVDDDKLAQDAALLLDRLVRQGRAFGIHVLLGSQTLGGAYSLARSTIGQMAVRIALQCSEADAHLILSEDNTAARLPQPSRRGDLQRPERPARGQPPVPGRLAARRRTARVSRHSSASMPRRRTAGRSTTRRSSSKATSLPTRATTPTWSAAIAHPERTTHQEPTLWLGSAVRIEPATHLVLRRQGGHNLAIVGAGRAARRRHAGLGRRRPGRAARRGGGPVHGARRQPAGVARARACGRRSRPAMRRVVEVVPPRDAAAAIATLRRGGRSPQPVARGAVRLAST